jgi:hypothetical protein
MSRMHKSTQFRPHCPNPGTYTSPHNTFYHDSCGRGTKDRTMSRMHKSTQFRPQCPNPGTYTSLHNTFYHDSCGSRTLRTMVSTQFRPQCPNPATYTSPHNTFYHGSCGSITYLKDNGVHKAHTCARCLRAEQRLHRGVQIRYRDVERLQGGVFWET